MSNIELNSEAMQAVVSKAILDGISQEDKLSLVEQAIKYLVTAPPSTPGYGRTPEPTPLQRAFNAAVEHVSVRVVKEVITDDEIDKAIHDGIEKSIRASLANDSGWLINVIRDSVGDVVRERLQADK